MCLFTLGSARLQRAGFGILPKKSFQSSRMQNAFAGTQQGRSHDMGNTLQRYVPSVFPSRGRHFDLARPLNSRGKKGVSPEQKCRGVHPPIVALLRGKSVTHVMRSCRSRVADGVLAIAKVVPIGWKRLPGALSEMRLCRLIATPSASLSHRLRRSRSTLFALQGGMRPPGALGDARGFAAASCAFGDDLADFEEQDEHRETPYRYEGAPSAIRSRGGEIADRENRRDRVCRRAANSCAGVQ